MAIDLEVVRGSRKEPCPYCGGEEHKVPLACPRIAGITVYEEADCYEIHFWPAGSEPPLAS